MKALDTNVLLRYFIRDDPEQAAIAREFINSCTPEDRGFINLVVLAELLWVLRTKYTYNKSLIADTVQAIMETEQLQIENSEAVGIALAGYRKYSVDFADALIGAINRQNGVKKTATFDKRAAKLDEFQLLA